MSIDLERTFDTSDGIDLYDEVGETSNFVFPYEKCIPTYSGDLISYVEFFDDVAAATINRRLRIDYTYVDDSVTEISQTHYKKDGTTVLQNKIITVNYDGNDNVSAVSE